MRLQMASPLTSVALAASCTRAMSRVDIGGLDVVPVAPAGRSSPAPWPSAGHDARHSGSTAALGPLGEQLRWECHLEGNVTPGPAVAADDTIGRLLAIADESPCAIARPVPGSSTSWRPDAVIAVTSASVAGEGGLGIDDGPDERWTPARLAVLSRHKAHATFFDIGQAVDAHPALVAEVAAAGNEIGLHTSAHRALVGRTVEDVVADLEAYPQAVRAAGVEPQALLRPPRGRQDIVGAEAAWQAGVTNIGWSSNVERALNHPANLTATMRGGAIVLAHEGRRDRGRSVAALDGLLDALDGRGLHAVGIDRLLADAGVNTGVSATQKAPG